MRERVQERGEQVEDTRQAVGSTVTPVSVEIYDQVYHLRGTDSEYIQQLADLVDGKMRAVAAQGTTVDSLRVAVLAALNITDELLAARARYEALAGSAGRAQARAGTLAGMLDEVLEPARRVG